MHFMLSGCSLAVIGTVSCGLSVEGECVSVRAHWGSVTVQLGTLRNFGLNTVYVIIKSSG